MDDTKQTTSDIPKTENGLENIFLRVWKPLRYLAAVILRFFNIRQIYYLDAKQAHRRILSEYAVLHSIVLAKPKISAEEHDAIEEIEKLISEAKKITQYEELWPYIHLIELQVLRLYDIKALYSQLTLIRNNLFLLNAEDKQRWEAILAQFDDFTKPVDEPYFRSVIYTITSEIQEARRLNYMTNDLKRALMKRFFWITLLIGVLAWAFAFSIIRDTLVHYAVIFGLLGGFFSRVLSIRNLEFKPPAFSLLALYTYIQPLFGGIGAIILYVLLISPIGPSVISGDTFYLSPEETHTYIVDKLTDKTTLTKYQLPSLITDTKIESTSKIISQYPKPGLFLLLSFLAGFSERWLLGTLDTIVGKKLQKNGDSQTADANSQAQNNNQPKT
jgi:hypothetical protein